MAKNNKTSKADQGGNGTAAGSIGIGIVMQKLLAVAIVAAVVVGAYLLFVEDAFTDVVSPTIVGMTTGSIDPVTVAGDFFQKLPTMLENLFGNLCDFGSILASRINDLVRQVGEIDVDFSNFDVMDVLKSAPSVAQSFIEKLASLVSGVI